MTVISCEPHWSNRRGDNSIDALEFEAAWRVITNNPKDGPATVLAEGSLAGLPLLRGPYVEPNGTIDLLTRCYRREPLQDQDDPTMWLVRCYYKINTSTKEPWRDPPTLKWGGQKWQKPLYYDKTPVNKGGPLAVVNSACELYDPPPTADATDLTLSIYRAQTSFNPSLALTYMDAVNSDTWHGFGPNTVKVETISAESKLVPDTGIEYWGVTYNFLIRRDTWFLILFDMGWKELDPNGKQKPIVLAGGLMPATPQPLDGKGHTKTIDFTKPIWGQLVTLEYVPYIQLPFKALGL